RGAQPGGLSLLSRHGDRFLPALRGIVQDGDAAQRSPLRRPPRPAGGPGVRARPCEPPPPPAVGPESSATISIAPTSTSFLSDRYSMSCEDICPLFRGPRCSVLPRGRAMLRGFPVLLVTAAMCAYFLPFAGVSLLWLWLFCFAF